MSDTIRRDRIIRYAKLPDGLLSQLDRERNILTIDPDERAFLAPDMQNILDCSDARRTRLRDIHGRFGFEAF